ncbi:MAG: hypothetical protein Q9165_008037 [Trypethelium subeluteriae]
MAASSNCPLLHPSISTDTSTTTGTATSKTKTTKIITEDIPDAIITLTAPVPLPTTAAEETTAPTVPTALDTHVDPTTIIVALTTAPTSTSTSTSAATTTPNPIAEAPPPPLLPLPPTMPTNPPAAATAAAAAATPPPPPNSTTWHQRTLTLPSRGRGAHLITQDLEAGIPEIRSYRIGLLHVFAQHTSCALSLNENWDADVRLDMADALDRIVPEEGSAVGENLRGLGSGRSGGGGGSGKETKGRKGAGQELYRHSCEGADDMPAHVKSALIGASVSVPISEGKLATGTWQGVYLLEFRNGKQSRRLVATLQGERL